MKRILAALIKYTIVLGLPIVISLFVITLASNILFEPINAKDTTPLVFEVAPNDTFTDVSRRLKSEGFIKSETALIVLARIRGLDKRLKAGEYKLTKALSLYSLIKLFDEGETLERQVTIPEGSTIAQIVDLYDESSIIPKDQLLNALHSRELIEQAGVRASSFEGYLFPDTYRFPKGTPGKEIITTMLRRGVNLWPAEFSDRAEEMGMNRHEVLTLASIVEKESGNVEEQPKVASVFLNRLKAGMKLQSDPTVIYGIKDFDGDIRKKDLEDPHPYNTYVHEGLPPSPIANPGETAIRAVLFPAETEYLFFVADNTGKHVFSKTYAEHRKAVNKYQKQR